MGLQLILGSSGSGKSHYIFEKIIRESMENPRKQFLVLVPEQFTMQTQRDLVTMHPRHAIMNIDVLSFDRLAHRVFDEVGGEHRRILEDTGKSLILRRLAEEKREELTLLGGSLRKLGYISEMKSLISEFTQYRIDEEKLASMMEKNRENPQLYFKLKDIEILYRSFREYLEGAYLTAEELLGALKQVIGQSETVRGSVIVLDGYTGFTPVQMELLRKLLVLAEEVYVPLTLDSQEQSFQKGAEYELFYLTRKTAADLESLAKEEGIVFRPPLRLKPSGSSRHAEAPELAFLESRLFRYGRQVWQGKPEAVRLYAAVSPRQEAEAIGRMIQQLVRDQGFRYRDLAVITGDMETYGTLLEQTFSRLGIPGFMDLKRDVLHNPFVEFLRALLAAVQEEFSYESMFRLLRSGMTGIWQEEADLLENYVLARGIRGLKRWSREWKFPLKSMEEEELRSLNELREKALKGLPELDEALKRKDMTARSLTEALYTYLTRLQIQQQLKRYEEQFDREGSYRIAREYAQIYGMVMELFDKLVLLLGDCRMELEEYSQLLDAGLAEMKVGLIPSGTDQVVVGDMERSRLKDVKILFFAGVNEGSVPRDKSRGGILSEMERELLQEQKTELAPTARQETYIQKFYMYSALTLPSCRLFLSWSLTDAEGGALRPSQLISRIRQLFPEAEIETAAPQELLERLVTPDCGVTELIHALGEARFRRASEEQRALIRWYDGQEFWKKKLQELMDAVCMTRDEDHIGKAVARALYGTLLEGSVTRLEQFAACAYAHFLQYGLRLTERETCGLEAIDLGNVFHGALKYFSDAVEQGGYGWFQVPEEKRVQWMKEALERAMEDTAERVFADRAQDGYVLERVRRIGQRTAWAVLRQLERGAFFPDQTEVSFRNLEQLQSVSVLLSEDERMRLKGRIDRIDVCREDGKVYVRVIDYKSGKTKFDLTSVYYGLQLQLAVYLNAAMELERRSSREEVHPAGMFYYHIEDPMLEYLSQEDPESRILEELALNGLVNGDRKIVELMDREALQGSAVLPLKFKKDGGYTAASSVAEEEQILRLSRHVQKKLVEYGERILNGDIGMKPYELGEEDACQYCSYHSVCGFDRKMEGCEKRRLTPLEKEEVWRRLEEEEG